MEDTQPVAPRNPIHLQIIIAVLTGLLVGGIAVVLLSHARPLKTLDTLGQVHGFTPYTVKTDAQTDFTLVQSTLSYSSGVLLYQVKNPVGTSVTITEQRVPAGYNTTSLQQGAAVTTEYGRAYITDAGATTATMITTDHTWVILNAPTPIGADAMQQLVQSLAPTS